MASQMLTPLLRTVVAASCRSGMAVRPPSSIKSSTGLQPFSFAVRPGRSSNVVVRAVRACTESGVLIPRVLGVRAVELIMTAPLSQDLRERIVRAVEGGSSIRQAARRFAGQRVRGHQADAAGTPDGQHGTSPD